jgi:hypothetical protein
MDNIICPNCQRQSNKPIFHCPRCGRDQVQEVSTEGPQIVIHFHGEMARSIVVSYQQKPVNLKLIDITGPRVLLKLEGDVDLPQSVLALYDVLQRGEELWELQGQTA